MKQQSLEFINERPSVRLVFLLWQKYKGYDNCFPGIGHYLELVDTFSNNHKLEMSDGRFFNHLFLNKESSVGFDGDELIDILHYETVEILKQRLTR